MAVKCEGQFTSKNTSNICNLWRARRKIACWHRRPAWVSWKFEPLQCYSRCLLVLLLCSGGWPRLTILSKVRDFIFTSLVLEIIRLFIPVNGMIRNPQRANFVFVVLAWELNYSQEAHSSVLLFALTEKTKVHFSSLRDSLNLVNVSIL